MKRISESDRKDFCESVGLVLSGFGLARMAGRVLGWLMIAEPPQQSAGQLVAGLGASKGSISTNTRLLVQMGFIEKVGLPGERSTYFRLVDNPLQKLVEMEMHGVIGFKAATERGLALMGDADSAARRRLVRHQAVWAFLEREYPKLVERFLEEHADQGEE